MQRLDMRPGIWQVFGAKFNTKAKILNSYAIERNNILRGKKFICSNKGALTVTPVEIKVKDNNSGLFWEVKIPSSIYYKLGNQIYTLLLTLKLQTD